MLIVFLCVILILMILIIVIETQSLQSGTIPAPTFAKTRHHMISLMPEKPDGDILELGCGWGGALLSLAKAYPHNRIIGYEITSLPYWFARLRVLLSRQKNITLLQKDFMMDSFENAGAIFCYLPDEHMVALEPKFKEELSETAVIVSHSYPLPNLDAVRTETIKEGLWLSTMYVYRM